jgi:hypothetical protein
MFDSRNTTFTDVRHPSSKKITDSKTGLITMTTDMGKLNDI